MFIILQNLTLKSMGRFCSTPPTSSSIFSSFLQLSTPLQAWIVQDIQVFQMDVVFLTGLCGFRTIQENSPPKLWTFSIFLGRHAPFYLSLFRKTRPFHAIFKMICPKSFKKIMNTIFNPQNVKNNIILGKVINGGEVILYNTINIAVVMSFEPSWLIWRF